MAITGSLSGTLALTDNLAGSVQLQKTLALSFLGTIAEYSQSQSITGTVTLNLPLNPTQFLYIKNLSATAGQTITVTWTPTGGSTATIVALQPGGSIIFIETNTTSGISALSVTAAIAATPIEYVLLG